MIYFDVIGEPEASPRPRVMRLGGTDAKGKPRVRMYVPSTADKWKRQVRAAAAGALDGHRLYPPGVAVEIHLAFRIPRFPSHYRRGKPGLLTSKAPRHHTQAPDRDNLEKAVIDALGDFAGLPPLIWCNDCQVVAGPITKRWALYGEPPGVAVAIWEFQG